MPWGGGVRAGRADALGATNRCDGKATALGRMCPLLPRGANNSDHPHCTPRAGGLCARIGRPQEIDEAARRRLVKRLYIPLPEGVGRRAIVVNLLKKQRHDLTDEQIDEVVAATEGYSGSDMAHLCREAAMGPIRTITDISCISPSDVRHIQLRDFEYARTQVRASVSTKDLDAYVEWNKQFGSLG